jgi:hypothetical protein
MRVEIVEKLPELSWVSEKKAKDTPENRALHNFLSSLTSEDSYFSVEYSGSGPIRESGRAGEVYCGDFVITFRSPEDKENTALHFTLLEKLSELFRSAGSSATLGVILSLLNVPASEGRNAGLALGLRLEANGDSVEQAELRWGLGLAHMQQGLLFASRWLRQQNSSRAN